MNQEFGGQEKARCFDLGGLCSIRVSSELLQHRISMGRLNCSLSVQFSEICKFDVLVTSCDHVFVLEFITKGARNIMVSSSPIWVHC